MVLSVMYTIYYMLRINMTYLIVFISHNFGCTIIKVNDTILKPLNQVVIRSFLDEKGKRSFACTETWIFKSR